MTRPTLIKQNSFPPSPAPWTDLPFIAEVKTAPRKKEFRYWDVPATDSYGHANDVGRQYAADLAQYLKQNPIYVGSGMLSCIIGDMAKIDNDSDSAMKGYAVGFWAFVEQLLHAAATRTDHYALAETIAQRHAAWVAAYDTKAKEGGE